MQKINLHREKKTNKQRANLIAGHLLLYFSTDDCDDEAVLVVASVGADPYRSSSHGFCQMELLVAIPELQHSESGGTAH